ncbi:MAG: hypothetical protein A3J38_06190 [Gammaproteobacteria bacterium RIFCSPHIGHO2_12_FULL_45_9]|nr:MAG: hypothetical protein A3J38_06190 [Gammaproteobacteria bacterium RIFCSPHIGHO2_12_FULL_45_9]
MTEKQAEQTALNSDGVTLVLMRNAFYRDNYKRAVFSVMAVFFTNLVLAAGVLFNVLNPPDPEYFATTAQYQLIKWSPLSDPVVSDNFVRQWVADAVREAFSLDFVHWREQLMRASNRFTPSGWYWFSNALKSSGDLKTLVELNMVSDAAVTGSPVIEYKSVLSDRYLWKVAVPIMITFTNGTKTIRQPMRVTLIVQRVSVANSPDQIAINQFLPEVQAQPQPSTILE